MKTILTPLSLAIVLIVCGCAPPAPAQSGPAPGGAIVEPDLLNRRTREYDYTPPAPGSYRLPVIKPAADGLVLGSDGVPIRLHDLIGDRITVVSFIYTRCTDPTACPRATGALAELQRITRQFPAAVDRTLLLSLSFDPAHDTPKVMSRYGRVVLGYGKGAEWLFLTTRTAADLLPLLQAYGQRVDRKKDPGTSGPFYHPLRVYLIDRNKRIRNIYSTGLLDPRMLMTDIQTLLLEEETSPNVRTATGTPPKKTDPDSVKSK